MPQLPPSSKPTSAPRPAPAPADARRVAFRALERILEGGETLDDAFDTQTEAARLEPRDRAFARLLLLSTLRYMGFLDARLRVHAPRLDKTPLPALLALRLGAAQLLLLATPAHAAISTSVNLVPQKITALRGLVNAVLRRLAGEGPVSPDDVDTQSCFPAWLKDIWKKDYGAENTARLCAALLREPATDITVKADAPAWARKLGATLLPTGSIRLPRDDKGITQLEGFAEGAFWVQDAAAALPVRLAGHVDGMRVFDLCAAPGGKTAQLAAAGAHVSAVDVSEKRLQRLKENLERLKLPAEVICCDVLQFTPAEKADVVLLDAPCSATGTLRRNPDLMHRKGASDIGRLAALQMRLLAHAATLVKPGGMLVYAVCALQKQEGEDVIEGYLRKNPAFTRLPLRAEDVGGLPELVTKAGDLRTLPFHMDAQGGMDGFYAARLIRKT